MEKMEKTEKMEYNESKEATIKMKLEELSDDELDETAGGMPCRDHLNHNCIKIVAKI